MASDNMIAALLRERDTYKTQGKTDRVRQVDEQLAHYGHTPEAEEPQGRTATPQQSAVQGRPPTKKTAEKKTAPPPAGA
ncbi:hypothetical protein [Streptomyces sp. NPDC003032]